MPSQHQHRRRTGPARPQSTHQPKTPSNKLVNALGEISIERFINKAIVQEQADAYQAQHSFADFGLDQRLVDRISARGYLHATPIQDQAIKPILAGQDLIGLANTGTGKTAAFLLPILHHYLHGNNQGTLIIVPTRELAAQIFDEFTAFVGALPIYATVVVGGESINRQIASLKRGPHIVIGTPGRLKDLLAWQNLSNL